MAGDVSELEHWQHQYDLKAKRVMLAGSTNQILIDKTTTANMTYIGYGAKKLATSDTGWLLRRIDKTTSTTTIKTAFSSWDLRADGATTYE